MYYPAINNFTEDALQEKSTLDTAQLIERLPEDVKDKILYMVIGATISAEAEKTEKGA